MSHASGVSNDIGNMKIISGDRFYLVEDITTWTFKIALGYYLCKLPLGEDMVVPLPNSLNGHGGSKKTISYTKNCKDDNKNNHKGKACLH